MSAHGSLIGTIMMPVFAWRRTAITLVCCREFGLRWSSSSEPSWLTQRHGGTEQPSENCRSVVVECWGRWRCLMAGGGRRMWWWVASGVVPWLTVVAFSCVLPQPITVTIVPTSVAFEASVTGVRA